MVIGATLLQMLLFAVSLFGGHDFEQSSNGSTADSVESVKLISLRADGALDFQNTKGLTGSGCVTIPPRRSGHGQKGIQIQARTDGFKSIVASAGGADQAPA